MFTWSPLAIITKAPSLPCCFRTHYVVEELSSIPPGAYYITPATFKPKEAIFSLTVSTDCVFSLDKVH